jgi:hypothetical protein
MQLGFNYAWSRNAYSGDFGPDFNVGQDEWNENNRRAAKGDLAAIPPHKLFDFLAQNLNDLRGLGFRVVRWFILGNGNAYGGAPRRLTTGVGAFDYDWDFTPPAVVDIRFRRDFAALLTAFKAADMQLLPSFIDFKLGSRLLAGPGANGTFYGARADVIRDAKKRAVFLDTVLAELLAASKPFAAQIYAWEVINEPFWLCNSFGALALNPPFSHKPEVTASQMKSFLAEANSRIEGAGFKSTVGHRYFNDLSVYPSGRVRQFHYYAKHAPLGYSDPSRIQGGHLFDVKPPPVLGEFESDRNLNGSAWPELSAGDTTLARLRLLESEGCDLALIWPDIPDSSSLVGSKDVIKLSNDARRQVAVFTNGVVPPPDRAAPL